MVIVHKDTLKQNTDTFIQENQIIQLNKERTESFQKQIKQTIHKCNTVIDKNQQKYLIKIKSTGPKCNSLIKIINKINP